MAKAASKAAETSPPKQSAVINVSVGRKRFPPNPSMY